MTSGRSFARRAVALAALGLAFHGCAPVYSRAVARSPIRTVPASPRTNRGPVDGLARILGELVWPLAMDKAMVLSSTYGHRAGLGGGGFHEGLDLRAAKGTPVYAVAAGRVVESGASGAYGNRIVLDHGEGLRSLYAHHERNLVTKGQIVRRGQVIALVGHTGNATGDHLHFELRWKEAPVDPWTVLPPLGARRGG